MRFWIDIFQRYFGAVQMSLKLLVLHNFLTQLIKSL